MPFVTELQLRTTRTKNKSAAPVITAGNGLITTHRNRLNNMGISDNQIEYGRMQCHEPDMELD